MITVLAGGIGAAKFLEGLVAVLPPEEITVIANTGDDAVFYGLAVSPDIDTVMYTLAGIVDRERGWGLAGETFACLGALRKLGEEAWFNLGDQDIATHLYRTRRLREGATLTVVTQELRKRIETRFMAFGLMLPRILPMTDEPAPTVLRTSHGMLDFQEYFVKLRQLPEVQEVDLSAAARKRMKPAPGVIEAITESTGVIIAPSNPLISIGPILAVPGIREALRTTTAPIAAISPIVGGKALKGPADKMLASLGLESSATAVAQLYRDFLDLFVLDEQDSGLRQRIEEMGVSVEVTETVMASQAIKERLARTVLEKLSVLCGQ